MAEQGKRLKGTAEAVGGQKVNPLDRALDIIMRSATARSDTAKALEGGQVQITVKKVGSIDPGRFRWVRGVTKPRAETAIVNVKDTTGSILFDIDSNERKGKVAKVYERRARIAGRTAWLEEASLVESLNQTLMRLDATMGEVRNSLDALRESTKLQVDYLQSAIATMHERFDEMEAKVASKTDVRGLDNKLDILLSHITSVEAKPESPAKSAQPPATKSTRRKAKSGSS